MQGHSEEMDTLLSRARATVTAMCDRYASFCPAGALRQTFQTVNSILDLKPSWNVAPTQLAPVVRRHPETGERRLDLLQWGLARWWQSGRIQRRPINCRAETITESAVLRGAFKWRRCIVPADAFYKWKSIEGGKQSYAIARMDGLLMAFAGVWEECRLPDWRVLCTFAIVTTVADAELAEVHDRMPVILEPADWPVWLGELEGDPGSLLHPAPDGMLRTWLVNRRVDDPRNNGRELLEPIGLARGNQWFDWRGTISGFDRVMKQT